MLLILIRQMAELLRRALVEVYTVPAASSYYSDDHKHSEWELTAWCSD